MVSRPPDPPRLPAMCFFALPYTYLMLPSRFSAPLLSAPLLFVFVSMSSATTFGQLDVAPLQQDTSNDSAEETDVASEASRDKVPELQFAFDGTPWREVIQWLAASGDLALHVGDIPPGSFTYTDNSTFTPQQAIDRVNLFLLPQGFTLIRTGRLLSVLNLVDNRSTAQLDALARLVKVEELADLESYDVVKCLFPLGELDAEDAVEELGALNLMTAPAVFSKTNQLMITDTVARLKSVKAILDVFEPDQLDNGTVVETFNLKHVDSEDILMAARPHLGLATGEMIGIDVSLSADPKGKSIFVTGIEDKVRLMKGLIEKIDQPKPVADDGEAVLMNYPVEGGNVEMVYNVLQTLLVGREVRLSADKIANTIVALATPSVQAEIKATVDQLQANEPEFAVIELKTVDPFLAVSLIEELLDVSSEDVAPPISSSKSSSKSSRSLPSTMPSSGGSSKLHLDADPVNRRLFVRGTKKQIEQVRQIVAELDDDTTIGSSDQIRIYPVTGAAAEELLKTVAKFWKQTNPIFYYAEPDQGDGKVRERMVFDDLLSSNLPARTSNATKKPSEAPGPQLLTQRIGENEPAIRCQMTPRGMLLQSEDTEALDELEELLQTVGGPADEIPSPPVVYYLKYTRSSDALHMLAELLDGGQAAKELITGSLINASIDSSVGGFVSSIITSRDGTMTMMNGSLTIVADSRLNRLIVQGSTTDVEKIEAYLKIIDKDQSLTQVETYGRSRVLELTYSKASEVAEVIREAYSGRMSSGGSPFGKPGSGTGSAAERAAVAAAIAAAKSGKSPTPPKSAAAQARDLEPKMTVTVHEPSNSLIVTAQEPLLNEVEVLVKQIDERNRKSVRVIRVPDGVEFDLLNSFLQGEAATSSPASSSKSKK